MRKALAMVGAIFILVGDRLMALDRSGLAPGGRVPVDPKKQERAMAMVMRPGEGETRVSPPVVEAPLVGSRAARRLP
jgi:hypothetical protein